MDRGEVKSVRFAEPLHYPEDDIEPEEAEAPEEEALIQEAPVTETAPEAAEAPAAEAPKAESPKTENPKAEAPKPAPAVKKGTEIKIPETADEEPIELIFEEPTLF